VLSTPKPSDDDALAANREVPHLTLDGENSIVMEYVAPDGEQKTAEIAKRRSQPPPQRRKSQHRRKNGSGGSGSGNGSRGRNQNRASSSSSSSLPQMLREQYASFFTNNANRRKQHGLQALPQSAVPISQHPKLRNAVQLNQMFLPSSEPGHSGWHILDPEGKRVMDPKKFMEDEVDREQEQMVYERDQDSDNEEGEHLKVTGDAPESRDDERGNSDEAHAVKGEEGFAASNKDSLRGAFLPIDAPVDDEEVNDSEDE